MKRQSILQKLIVISAFSPLIYLIVFYSLVFRVSLQLGRLPHYGDDSDRFDFSNHKVLVNGSFNLTLVLILFFLIANVYLYFTREHILKKAIIIFAICILIFISHFLFDPMYMWFSD